MPSVPTAPRAPVAFALALLAAGCTVRVEMPALPPQHPASAQAPAAPLPPPSPLLDSYRETPPAAAPAPTHRHGPTQGEPSNAGEPHEHHAHPLDADATSPGEAEDHQRPADSLEEAGAEEVVYACPMHPEVTSRQPGTCPVCGMELEPQEKEEP